MANNIDKVDQTEQTLEEWGKRPPLPPTNDIVPPARSLWSVPSYLSFNAIVNQISHTYLWTYDVALRDCAENARAMLFDTVIADALDARLIPVIQLDWHLEARDESDPQQVAAVANLTEIIKETPNRTWLMRNLLMAVWYGRCAVQLTYEFDYSKGYKRMIVKDHVPFIGDKLVFKWSGVPGVLVHPLFDGSWEPTVRGRAHFFQGGERETLIVHHFQPIDSDFFDYQAAGSVLGVGLRNGLYYYWQLKARVFGLLLEYMQRTALGYTIYYFEDGNPESLAQVQAAAAAAVSGNAILFPRKLNGGGPGIERLEPGIAGAELFRSLITNYFDDVMRQYILGQSLTTEAGGTGMGSGVAGAHQSTQEMRISYDAVALGETLTEQFVKVLCRWNHPGVPCPRFVFDVDKPNVGEYMEAAQLLYEMGVTLDADDLRSVTGLPKPEPNHEIVSKMVPEQPATVGTPAGVPVEAQAGQPQPGDQQQPQQGQPQPQVQGQPQQELGPPVVRQSRLKKAMVQLARKKREALLRKGGAGSNGFHKR